ncbi:MAG TPA: hypothetical protein VGI22_02485 [Xanthobacteraceae bacterium]|jgi:hypothetical protein
MIHLVEHLEGDGATVFAHACRLGFEGIVSKHRDHPYRSGPSKAYLKVKNPRAAGRAPVRGSGVICRMKISRPVALIPNIGVTERRKRAPRLTN